MADFTKGEWKAKREHNMYNIYVDDKLLFLSYQHPRTTLAEIEANAQLIASAPELFEALRKVRNYLAISNLGDEIKLV